MARNLKALGLAIVAALALSGIIASAASAGELGSDGPVTLNGEEIGEANENRLTSFGSFVSCAGSTYTAHKYDVTPHEFIATPAKTVTVTPHYVNCKSTALGFATTVDMNSCDYVFHFNSANNNVLATVDCSGESHIEVTSNIFGSHCTTTILENETGYEGLSAADNEDGTITLSGTVTGIEAHREGPGCPGGTSSTTEGALHQNILVSGENEEGGATEISIE